MRGKEIEKKQKEVGLEDFLELSNEEVAEIVKRAGTPRHIAVMMDGTRRMLKLDPKYREDKWLYEEKYIRELVHKSVRVADSMMEMGVEVFSGPLASIGNLKRERFVPEGLRRLLDPLLDRSTLEVLKKHQARVFFYGDLDYLRRRNGGQMVDEYIEFFKEFNQEVTGDKKVLVGLGFATDRETKLIADQAVDFYKEKGRKPKKDDLIKDYFGCQVPEIDIFIRTNEIRASGGLTPLLTGHNTQFYFPVAPGIVSLSEKTAKTVVYDYLFNRNISTGRYEHQLIEDKQAEKIEKFYNQNKDRVLGVGDRVGDIWIAGDKI